ncbi:MAG: hypothetical protein IOC63_21605 [Methylobacterium sp.]|nr:hypothetical protein [Methylobacterium sp.]
MLITSLSPEKQNVLGSDIAQDAARTRGARHRERQNGAAAAGVKGLAEKIAAPAKQS